MLAWHCMACDASAAITKTVLKLLEVLIPRINTCKEEFDPSQVAIAMIGLQNLQVRQLARILTRNMRDRKGTLRAAQSVGMALYGLR